MFANLKAEMARNNMSVKDVAQALGMRYGTLSGKINGRASFTIDEAWEITRLFEGCTIDYLFEKKE